MTSFLIVRLGSLGDVIHAIPAAAALRRTYEQARVDWIVDPRYLDLLNLVTCVDRRIPMDPRMVRSSAGRARLRQTLGELRAVHYDAAIDLQGLLKSAVLARLVHARRTIGFPKAHLREPHARFLYSETPSPGEATHVILKNLALLETLGVIDQQVQFPLSIPDTPTVNVVRGRFGAAGFVLINPGAAWPNKRWPVERFGALALGLREEFGLRSLVLWGPGEQNLAEAVVTAAAGAAEISPPTSIVDLVAIAHHARLMISGDTGPLHVAAAVGTPIVALFGPTYPERNGPWVRDDVTLSRVTQCACHYQRTCRRPMPCIDDIEVAEVLAAVRQRMAVHG